MKKTKEIMIAEMEALGVPRTLISQLLKEQFNVGYTAARKLYVSDNPIDDLKALQEKVSEGPAGYTPPVDPMHWFKQAFSIQHAPTLLKVMEKFDTNDHDADRMRYAIYGLGNWGVKNNQVDPRTCKHRVGNWCDHHSENCNIARFNCEYKEDKMHGDNKVFRDALKEFYYNKLEHKGVSQGDLVFVAHPNPEMEGWYQKVKDNDGVVRYMGINTKVPKKYNCNRLESHHQPSHGTMTRIVRGDSVAALLRQLTLEYKGNFVYTVLELKPTKEELIKDLEVKLESSRVKYNHNVTEARKVGDIYREINAANGELKDEMDIIHQQLRVIQNA